MNNKKTILFLSGTRADFGKLKSLINVVDELDEFQYKIFVTGMHLLKRYGSTFKEIENSGFKNIHKYINQHVGEPMEMILANTIHGLSRYVHENRPDMIVVHGDRVEALAGAIVGSMNNILVAHIEGGERSGTIDELIRHSVTKLSHLHLVANEEAKSRVLQMGEEEDNIFVIGSADIDIMKSGNLPSLESVKEYYKIPFDEYHIVMFHPVTTEVEMIGEYACNLVDALVESNQNYIIVYPNNDHGTNEIIDAYKKLDKNERFKIFPSIRFESFLTLIEYAKSMIGNSSAGIREAPICGVPTINIGTRQDSRFKSDSIIDCGYDKQSVMDAISKVSKGCARYKACEYFGNGNSANEFRKLLLNDTIWKLSPQKNFKDLE
ncbi:MAG TPA: UDP-N-acetylglucosamine 2-epimerase (hydrolyzing) [Epsilonproteobacteria bacterium]|nr:UDP-N-acetylglucosamine 2-epimerase (hydrolyzing) [Campylobacterota bacterium]